MYQTTQGPPPVSVIVGPFLQNYIPLITQATINELVSKSGMNAVRAAFNQRCQQDQAFFARLVQMVADHADMVVSQAGGQTNIPDQIARSAVDICALQASVFAYSNQQMFPGIDPATASGITRAVGLWENLAMQLAQFSEQRARGLASQQHWGNQSNNWGQPAIPNPANRGYGGQPVAPHVQQHAGGYGTGPFVPAGWNSQPPPPPTGGISNGGMMFHAGNPLSLTGETPSTSPLTSVSEITEISSEPSKPMQMLSEQQVRPFATQQAQPMKTNFPVMRPLAAAAATPLTSTAVSTPAQNYTAPANTNATISTERGWDEIRIEDRVVRPAFMATDWRRTFSSSNPYGYIYQPSTHLLMLCKDANGNITENLKSWDSTMEYLKHELNPDLRAKVQDQLRKESDKVWTLVGQVKFAKTYPFGVAEPNLVLNEENREEFFNQEDLEICPEFVKARTLEDGINSVRMDQGLRQANNLSGSVYEYYIDLNRPVLAGLGDLSTVENLAAEVSLPVVLKHLQENTSSLDQTLLRVIDQRLAAEISFHLAHSLGLRGWAISSFIGDFDELKQLIDSRYGEELWFELAGLYQTIISRALSVKTGDSLRDFLEYEGRELADDEDLVVFSDNVSVTELGISSDRMSLTIDEGGLLRSSIYPESYEALKGILDRLNMAKNAPAFSRHYLRTSDGKLYYLMRPYLGLKDAGVLIYPVK